MRQRFVFSQCQSNEDYSFDSSLEHFYKLGGCGLVRENLQNSIDGKLNDSDKPVVVTIKTGVMKSSEIPGIDEIKAHAASLKGGNSYTRETVKHIQEKLESVDIPYVTFEDENTKGLTGAKLGNVDENTGTWAAYAYKKGCHSEVEDDEAEATRGGSHGKGKIACNAASDVHLMFCANCDENGEKHLGGTVQFIEHKLGNKYYRATGYFSDQKDGVLIPFENKFGGVFEKNTRGLKTIVPFLRASFQSDDQLVTAVCDNFYIAIITGKLIVKVNEVLISQDTILDIVKDEKYYPKDEKEFKTSSLTPFYVKTYLESVAEDFVIKDKSKNYNFKLFFSMDESIKKGRMAIVRGLGMKIEDKKVAGYANAKYNAVLIPMGKEEDIFLKSLENESHTSLSSSHIRNEKVAANAKRFINNITTEMQKYIAKKLEEANPTDGKIDTSEVLNSIEGSFRNILEKSTPSVTVSTGTGEQTIIKIKGKKPRKKPEPPVPPVPPLPPVPPVPPRPPKPRPKKPRVEHERKVYEMPAKAVKRAVIGNKEYLNLDFNLLDGFDGASKCHISLYSILGDGTTNTNRLKIGDNYDIVKDLVTGATYTVDDDIIKNVVIKDGKVQIELHTMSRFNTALKFMYNVEVVK